MVRQQLTYEHAQEVENPIEPLVNSVPRHLWVTIITVATMLVVSWLLFKPPLPAPDVEAEAATTGETMEGGVVEVLSEEEMLIAEQAPPVQRMFAIHRCWCVTRSRRPRAHA